MKYSSSHLDFNTTMQNIKPDSVIYFCF